VSRARLGCTRGRAGAAYGRSRGLEVRWLTTVLVTGVVVCAALAHADTAHSPPRSATGAPAVAASSQAVPAPVISRSQLGETYYARRYGVDQMQVRYTASGESLEFRYRVLDPDKAAILSDKRARPYLIDEQSGAKLEVPVMDKVGALRQTTDAPEAGREYWMLFMNRGKLVRPGHRVDIEVGPFHVRGLTVQ
jgi:hypothetical protein